MNTIKQQTQPPPVPVPSKTYLADHYFRRRQFQECITVCDQLLATNSTDKAAWYYKTKCLSQLAYVDDTDLEDDASTALEQEQSVDEQTTAMLPRPGTSLRRPATQSLNQSLRPVSTSGRPVTGFSRPATSSNRMQTASGRLLTASGGMARLGTAALISESAGGLFINPDKLNLQEYAKRPWASRVLFEYLFYSLGNVRKALELASHAIQFHEYKDHWWKLQIGKCYYRLGMLRDSERHLKSSLKDLDHPLTYLHLTKTYMRLDQPIPTINLLKEAFEATHPKTTSLPTAIARTYELLGDYESSGEWYKKVISLDLSNVEAVASLAGSLYYNGQSEHGIRLLRRLIQLGYHSSPELWVNLGLLAFQANQIDLVVPCFERALVLSNELAATAASATSNSDENLTHPTGTMKTSAEIAILQSDIWYNFSHVAIGVGDMDLAYRCLKISVSLDNKNIEAWNNLGVLEYRRQEASHTANSDSEPSSSFVNACFDSATTQAVQLGLGKGVYEAWYNTAILDLRNRGDNESAYKHIQKALEIYPEQVECRQLLKKIQNAFAQGSTA